MTHLHKWFDREFPVDLPLWLLPDVIERLRGTPARLHERLADVPRRVLVHQPGGAWSIQEHAGHLLDLEPLWLGRVDDFEAGTPVLRPADLTNRATHQADHNARTIAQIVSGFRTARTRLVSRFEALHASQLERSARHPRLDQAMRPVDHAYFVAEHDDHHLARISGLLRGSVE
jgi:uncharacterized damage-inducible protein DinB